MPRTRIVRLAIKALIRSASPSNNTTRSVVRRTREVVGSGTGENPVVNPAGEMPDGRPFADARAFKQLLLDDRDKIARAFIEQLCTYGARRVLTVDDADDILAIVAAKRRSMSYRVQDMVRAVALSDLMHKR